MAQCSITTLLTSACDNDFMQAAQNGPLARAVILQLLYAYAGSSETLEEIWSSACSNGFAKVAQNPDQARAVILQQLCDIGA